MLLHWRALPVLLVRQQPMKAYQPCHWYTGKTCQYISEPYRLWFAGQQPVSNADTSARAGQGIGTWSGTFSGLA